MSPAGLPAPTLISVADMRPRFGFTPKRTYELLAAKAIKSVLMGRRRFIVLASVEDYIARLADEPVLGRTPNQHVARRDGAAVVPLMTTEVSPPDLSSVGVLSVPGLRSIQTGFGVPLRRVIAQQNLTRTARLIRQAEE